MTDDGKRVLIVEDDYCIALYLVSEVAEAGGKIAGVAKNVDVALDISPSPGFKSLFCPAPSAAFLIA
jgi:hypothetical protein